MKTTVGALLNMLRKPGRSAALGFSFLYSSVSPLMKSALSVTRTCHDSRCTPLGAWMPHSRMRCSVSRFTGWGLY